MAIHATLSGRLGADAEVDRTPNGHDVLKLSVATNDFRKGEKQTYWIRVAMYGQRAAKLAQYLQKGSFVTCAGKVWVDTWEGRDGNARTTIYMDASDIELGPRADADNKQGYSGRQNGGGGGYGTQPTPNDSDLPY